MKKNLGYVIIVIVGVLSLVSLMFRAEAVDNELAKENPETLAFAKIR